MHWLSLGAGYHIIGGVMMSRLLPTMALTGVFLASSFGFSQATNQNQNTQAATGATVRGKILRVEGQDRIIVQTTDNKEIILNSSPTTRYVIDGRAGRFTDLRTGVTVSATYTTQDNRYIVSSFQVGDAPNAVTVPGTPAVGTPAIGTTVQGKVVRVEGQDRVILQTTDNKEIILVSNPTTRYVINGKAGRFTDLRTGVNLRATYVMEGDRYIVNSFQVGDAPAIATEQGGINERKFRGRVVRIDAATNQIVAKTQDGKEVTLYVQKTARFLRNGQAVRMADIQVGTIVEAQYLERDNHWWVDEVILVTDATDPAPAAQGTQVQGTVVRVVGTNQIIVRTNDNKEVTIELVPQTVYTFDNQPGQLRDIQTGQDIRIQYDVRDRRSIASRIFGLRRK
jgi:translation initiation factor IF-1